MKSKNNIILAPTNYQGENWAHHGMVMMNHENRGSTRYMFSVGEKDNPLLLGLKRNTLVFSQFMIKNCVAGWIKQQEKEANFYPDNCSITII
mgnify:CR=1 FL=1